jgi:hypothetical protein
LPDRLPSLIVLLGFWIPPAIAGWMAAGYVQQKIQHARAAGSGTVAAGTKPESAKSIHALLAAFVLAYAVTWFFFNLGRMPPYIPGATMDPTVATPEATQGLALFTAALILPGSALACALAYRRRVRRP